MDDEGVGAVFAMLGVIILIFMVSPLIASITVDTSKTTYLEHAISDSLAIYKADPKTGKTEVHWFDKKDKEKFNDIF